MSANIYGNNIYLYLIGTCIETYINLKGCVRKKNYGLVIVKPQTLLASWWFALNVIPTVSTNWVYN
jgi:hypothetical protein